MTKEEFIEQVKEFVDYYCVDYIDKASWKMTSEDDDDFEAEVELEMPSRRVWTVPIGIDRNNRKEHVAAIAAAPDCDIYLSLDGEGLYTWLFFEAEKKLQEALARKESK